MSGFEVSSNIHRVLKVLSSELLLHGSHNLSCAFGKKCGEKSHVGGIRLEFVTED